jgi:hypothetical protein
MAAGHRFSGASMRAVIASLIATILVALPVTAQVRADPGVVIGGRIAVRVNVTLSDDDTPYYPVRGLSLVFARAGSDTVTGRTDEAGVVTVLLPPGNYTITTLTPYAWKGTSYAWSIPVTVRSDMGAVEFNRGNASMSRGARVAERNPPRSSPSATGAGDGSSRSENSVHWLSFEVGGEGGLTRFGGRGDSDAGYGGSGAIVGGIGAFALAIGYRYTSIRYGGDVDPGSLRGGTLEARYHFLPGAAPVRPYVGAVAALGRLHQSAGSEADRATVRMFGGSLGVQFGLATSVRLHLAGTVAGTHLSASPGLSSNGVFATANLGLTFDIFSPAR